MPGPANVDPRHLSRHRIVLGDAGRSLPSDRVQRHRTGRRAPPRSEGRPLWSIIPVGEGSYEDKSESEKSLSDCLWRGGRATFFPVRSLVKKAGLFIAAAWALSLKAGTADDIANLIKNSPFECPEEGRASAAGQTQLELRGVVMEGGVAWFTVFDSAAKKWLTLRQGQEVDALVVRRYDPVQDLVVLDYRGKTLSLALKPQNNQSYVGTRAAYAAVSSSTKAPLPMPVFVPALSEAETNRLARVASALKRQSEESKHRMLSAGAKGS